MCPSPVRASKTFEFEVTSHHHEGVRDLGEGLEVISRAEDGMVEALRHRELPWLGVQWHPERTAAGAGRSLMQEWLRSQC
jgi:gamma-glutamyl-gamma-aminobutyrate hydrolase PuuD